MDPIEKKHWFNRLLAWPPIAWMGRVINEHSGIRRFITFVLLGAWIWLLVDLYFQLRPYIYSQETPTESMIVIYTAEFELFKLVQVAFLIMLGFYFATRAVNGAGHVVQAGTTLILDRMGRDTPPGPGGEVEDAFESDEVVSDEDLEAELAALRAEEIEND